MTKTDLIQTAVAAAKAGDIDAAERCFDILNDMVMSSEEKHQVGCIIADCCAICDMVRA